MDFKKKENKKTAFHAKKPQTSGPKPKTDDEETGAGNNWFPGHMMKALRDIKAKVASVDLVLEIRDARVPIVSGSAILKEAIGGKSRLIIFNKANLGDPDANQKWSEFFEAQNENFIFVNCLERSSIKEVLMKAKIIIEEKRKRSGGSEVSKKSNYKFMVIGLPNTGKSTFINSIANRNATKVANKPGQTQNQIWVKVDEEIDLLDTPGVMPTRIEREVHRTWLSIINAIPDHITGEEDAAIYLIKLFLKNKTPEFMERFKFETLDNIDLVEVLDHIAKVRGCLKKGGADYDRVYKLILSEFREGQLGRLTLEVK